MRSDDEGVSAGRDDSRVVDSNNQVRYWRWGVALPGPDPDPFARFPPHGLFQKVDSSSESESEEESSDDERRDKDLLAKLKVCAHTAEPFHTHPKCDF